MKYTLEEIENFVSATLTVISKDDNDIFPMSDEYVADLVFGDLDEEDEDEEGVAFTDDEDEAIEIMKALVSNLDEESLDMYLECPYNEDEEDNEVDIKMLGKTIGKIKKMNGIDQEDEEEDEDEEEKEETKPKKGKKEKAKKPEKPEKPEKKSKKEKEPEQILMTQDQLTDFFIEIQGLVEDDFIMIEDESIVQKIPSAKTVNSFFKYLNGELMPEDLENITEKSLELLRKVKGKEIVLEEKVKKAEKAEKPEKPEKEPKRGRPRKEVKEEIEDDEEVHEVVKNNPIKEKNKDVDAPEAKETKEAEEAEKVVQILDLSCEVDFIGMFDEIIQVIKKYREKHK